MKENKALAAWRRGEQTVGSWLSVANVHTTETLARLGFDWLCIDMQHGLIDYVDLRNLLPAITATETTPLVRVPWNEPYEIGKALDAGAEGVIVPMVNTPEQAVAAARACRYPPLGERSFGPVRAALVAGRGYADESNGQIACIVMIETQEALDNVDAIAATPGVDGLYIGPSDLGLALGLGVGDSEHPEHAAAVARISEAAKAAGVAVGIHTSSRPFAQRFLDLGFHFVNVSSDVGFMTQAALSDLRALKAAGAERPTTGY